METYVNSAGKVVTTAQAEQEYRKQLIAAGRPLEGDEYDQGLEAWLGTYRTLTKSDKRSIGAATTAFIIAFALVALTAFVVLFTGGGLIGFVITLIVGAILSFGAAGLVVMFTD